MKKIISLIICAVLLCAFSVTAFADDDDDLLKDGKKWFYDATAAYNNGQYDEAEWDYVLAGTQFYAIGYGRGMLLAEEAYKQAVKAAEANEFPEHVVSFQEYVDRCTKYIKDHSNVEYIQVGDILGGIESARGSGFTLSTGNIAIIVGAASAIVFGVAGLIAGKAIGKKKALPKD